MDDQEQLRLRVRVAKAKAARAAAAAPSTPKHDTSVEDLATDLTEPTRAALDSASMGILPRAVAAGDVLAQVADPRGPKLSEVGDLYNSNLTKEQNAAAERAYKHPSASITGGFLPNLIPGVAEASAGSTALQRLVAAGGLSALAGNLTAPHADDAARGRGTVAGLVTGLGLQAAGEAAPSVTAKLATALRARAGSGAAGILTGGRAGISDKFGKIGLDPEDVSSFGARALDEGLIPTGLNPLESPVAGALKRTRSQMKEQGSAIGDAINEADASSKTFDPKAAQQEATRAILTRNPQLQANSTKARTFIDQVGMLPPHVAPESPRTFRDAQDMKVGAWKGANFSEAAPQEAQQYRNAVGGLRDSLTDQVGAAAGNAAATKLSGANEKYGYLSDVEKLAQPAASREDQLQKFGLPAAAATLAAGGVGLGAEGHAATGASLGALAAGALLKSRGPTLATRFNYLGSKAVPAAGELLQSPATSAGAAGSLSRWLGPGMKDGEEKAQSVGKAIVDNTPPPQALGTSMAGALENIRAKAAAPGVDVKPLDPTITARKPATVDVQAGEPISMMWTHQPDSPEAVASQLAREKDEAAQRRMKLARFFGGSDDDLGDLQVQR